MEYKKSKPNFNKKGKRKNRYKISNDEIALKLGLEINKSKRYTLTQDQIKQYSQMDVHYIKRLFFDIETSPMVIYSWRIGYKLNIPYENIIEDWKIICISYKWEHEDKVRHLKWDNKCDKQLLIDFIKIANTADELIGHNGDRFDIKKIRTRCIYHRIPMFPKYRTLDTLKKARGNFYFDSNRLDYIAKYLGVGAKLKHDGFVMWTECMKGNEKALKDMVKYCDMDVLVLEDVYLALQNYIQLNTHAGTHNGKQKASCKSCGSEDVGLLKNNFTAAGTIKRQLECNVCSYTYEVSNSAWRYYLETKSNFSYI